VICFCTAAFLSISPLPVSSQSREDQPQATPASPHEYLQRLYEELFELSPGLTFLTADLGRARQALKRG
jgi:hypothetical protein